jgi:type II secretory pathway pseudopilin PulG
MNAGKPETPLDLGIYGRQVKSRIEATDVIAAILSVLWVAVVAGFWVFIGISSEDGAPGFNPMTFVMTMVSILLPIGLIWVASFGAKTARVMREEAHRLQASIDAMRHAYVSQAQASKTGVRPGIEKQLDEIAAATRNTEAAIATFASRRDNPEAKPASVKAALARKAEPKDEGQASLELDTPPDAPIQPISIAEFIRAMNFPENEDDAEGFRTLRRALDDRDIAKMIRSSQDVLTLLSQDGIYMDDLRPDRPRAETWRKFAQGERGPAVSGLGGIRDRSCLALTSRRMKNDPVFRDAVHHFLRQFDSVLGHFESNATDAELVEMGETRTARAFMLLGKIAGTFD